MRLIRLYLRGRRFVPGAVAILAVSAASGLLTRISFPVPLNEAGARCALGVLVAMLAAQVWGQGYGVAIPALEGRNRPLVVRCRIALVAGQVCVVATGLLLSALVSSGLDGARMMAGVATTLGITAAATRLPAGVPFWFPSTALVLFMIVAGVDRVETRPEHWAFLLRDTPALSADEIVVPLVILCVGAALLITRPQPVWDS